MYVLMYTSLYTYFFWVSHLCFYVCTFVSGKLQFFMHTDMYKSVYFSLNARSGEAKMCITDIDVHRLLFTEAGVLRLMFFRLDGLCFPTSYFFDLRNIEKQGSRSSWSKV